MIIRWECERLLEKTIKVALGNERKKKRSSQFNSEISGKPPSGFLCFSELKLLNAIILGNISKYM